MVVNKPTDAALVIRVDWLTLRLDNSIPVGASLTGLILTLTLPKVTSAVPSLAESIKAAALSPDVLLAPVYWIFAVPSK